jgi:RNA polymerase sigma-70 factor (ECF subfamily)
MSPSKSGQRDVEGLYEEHGTLVYVIAMRILRDHQLAEDAAQESWIRISRQLDKGVRPEFEQSWVLTIARREALRIAERRRKARPLPEEGPSTSDRGPQAESEEERERLRSAMERLPEEDREIIRLNYLEELPPASLRKRLGLASRNGVSRRLRRAMGRLRRLLGGTE